MRPLTQRESGLAAGAAAVILLAVSWAIAEHLRGEWHEVRAQHSELDQRMQLARSTIEREAAAHTRLGALRARLPNHPRQQNVTADTLRTVEMLSAQSGLLLTRRNPEPERAEDGLHEVSIVCDWEGTLEALVHFLYAVQTHDAMLDIQRLTIRPISGQTGRLRGTVTVDAAFTREESVDARQ